MANWYQVNFDGFGFPPSGSAVTSTMSFVFGDDLFATNDSGLFRLDNAKCRTWKKMYTPVPPSWTLVVLGDYLYLDDAKTPLRWLKAGQSFTSANWQQATSIGLPGNATPGPMLLFKGHIYAVQRQYDATAGRWTFDVWRSQDLGKATMTWQQVVQNSFGDPANNHDVDMMAEFNNHLYVGTTTRSQVFGAPSGFGAGTEIWESASGDLNSWTQVNKDGFGTEITHSTLPAGQKLRTNQDIGSWAVYQPPAAKQAYLFVGTKSHFGAEVWRYDGKGKAGWQNVSPPGAGPGLLANPLKRFESMVVFKENPLLQTALYVAEGFDTGELSQYDGQSWTTVASAAQFGPTNGGFSSLAVYKEHLYASTRKALSLGATKGDQVWGYPYPYKQKLACVDLQWLNQWLTMVSPSQWQLKAKLQNSGAGPIEKEYAIAAYLDGELVYSQPGPLLPARGEAEVAFALDAEAGAHELVLVADDRNELGEFERDRRRVTLTFLAPTEEEKAADRLPIIALLLGFFLFAGSILRRLLGRRREE